MYSDDDRDSAAEWHDRPARFVPLNCSTCGRFVGKDGTAGPVDGEIGYPECGPCLRKLRERRRPVVGPLPAWASDPDAITHFRLTGEEPSPYDYVPFD